MLASLAATVASIALVPGFAPFASGPAHGELYRGVYPDRTAPQPLRPGYLYLPPGFSFANRYPVLYLLHGMPGTPSEYIYSLRLLQTADRLIATHQVRPFVAVLPAAGADVHYNGEWAGPWEDYLVKGVVPWVQQTLPVVPGPSGSTLAGLSAGGYGAVLIALHHPSLFGRVESWGGYFEPLKDGVLQHASAQQLKANDPRAVALTVAPTLRRLGVKILLSSGPKHGRHTTPQQSIDFAHELWTLHVPTKLDLLPTRKGMWRTQFLDGLLWALGAR